MYNYYLANPRWCTCEYDHLCIYHQHCSLWRIYRNLSAGHRVFR